MICTICSYLMEWYTIGQWVNTSNIIKIGWVDKYVENFELRYNIQHTKHFHSHAFVLLPSNNSSNSFMASVSFVLSTSANSCSVSNTKHDIFWPGPQLFHMCPHPRCREYLALDTPRLLFQKCLPRPSSLFTLMHFFVLALHCNIAQLVEGIQ